MRLEFIQLVPCLFVTRRCSEDTSAANVVVHSLPRSYPVRDTRGWTLLGHFTGEDTREAQSFKIEHPQHFAKYLKLEFVSHIGTEYYCPISVLRVFGVTMVEDYNSRQVALASPCCPSFPAASIICPALLWPSASDVPLFVPRVRSSSTKKGLKKMKGLPPSPTMCRPPWSWWLKPMTVQARSARSWVRSSIFLRSPYLVVLPIQQRTDFES